MKILCSKKQSRTDSTVKVFLLIYDDINNDVEILLLLSKPYCQFLLLRDICYGS